MKHNIKSINYNDGVNINYIKKNYTKQLSKDKQEQFMNIYGENNNHNTLQPKRSYNKSKDDR